MTQKWDVVKYSITFDVEGVEKIVVETGKTAEKQKPADPTKEGYTFVGWLNGEEAYDWTKPVTADVVLKASWTVIKYTINCFVFIIIMKIIFLIINNYFIN